MRVYVTGNLLLKEDSLPLRVMPRLQEMFPHIDFREFDPTEDFPEEKEFILIDTVMGIDKVMLIDDLDRIVTEKQYSLHDFDIGTNLKLMKKAGKLGRVLIIGVPQGMGEKEAVDRIGEVLKATLP